jgi:hypothetical protein
MIEREVVGGRRKQGTDERIAYAVTTTPWGSSPSNPVCKLYDITVAGTRTDVSTAKLTGSPTINGDVITTPLVYGLEADKLYRLEIQFVIGGNTLEAYMEIAGEY